MNFGTQISAYNPSDTVTLVLGERSTTLAPHEHGNGTKTVSQLFAEFIGRLGGDMSRVTSYTINGVEAPNHYQARAGETVRANVKSEKSINELNLSNTEDVKNICRRLANQ